MRKDEILSEIYTTFDKAQLDPILNAFKSSEMLHNFYHQRLFEIISESLSNEKEEKISKLQSQIEAQNTIITDLKQKINQIQQCYQSVTKENSDTLAVVASIESEIKEKSTENEKLANFISQLQTQKEAYMNQIEQITNENKRLNEKLNELANIAAIKDKELNEKNSQLNFFKDNLFNIKSKQDQMNVSLESMIKENFELKSEIESKNNDLNDLYNKLGALKLDFQAKSAEVNKEVERLRNENENVLKVKIQALKNKLKEKLNIIAKLNEKGLNID